jgi:ATP-dependent Lon protease
MACAIAAHLTVRHEVRQRLLESPTLPDLLQSLEELITRRRNSFASNGRSTRTCVVSLYRNQREFYLQEQLKAIHRELGQEDQDDLDFLAQQIATKGFPEAARARAERELRKLRRTPPMSPESTVGRNYVDWMLQLPWTERTDDVLDVEHARRVLDEDHFGLDEVKDRILDHIAVLAQARRHEDPFSASLVRRGRARRR